MVMKYHNIKNLIFKVKLRVTDELPITEKTQKLGSVYGRTKQICEQMITDYYWTDFNSTLFRYFNPIGTQCFNWRTTKRVPDNLIPYVTQTAIGKRKELTVFGTDYDTPMELVFVITSVVDLAKALLKAIVVSNEKKFNAIPINLGTGNGYSVKRFLIHLKKMIYNLT